MSINNPQINSSRSAFLLDIVSSRQANADWIDLVGNIGTYGWWGGGSATPTPLSIVDRIDFSNDSPTTASPRGPLSYGRISTAIGNANYGWFGPGDSLTSTIDRIDFTNDSPTTAISRGPMSGIRYQNNTLGNANYGWWVGGVGTGALPISTIDRIDFSNDILTTSRRGLLNLAKLAFGATSNANYGWCAGGQSTGPAITSVVDRIDFSNDSATGSPRGGLSSARGNLSASGNANYGWFGGGVFPAPTAVSLVDRIDFANDSPTAASPRGPLSIARYQISATGNANYGWFGGGFAGVPVAQTSIVDRMDFANDTVTAGIRGRLSKVTVLAGATSNYVKPLIVPQSATSIDQSAGTIAVGTASYGWWAGAAAGNTSVDRIDFANDTATALVRGRLAPGHAQAMAATSNANYGWWYGGATGGGASIISRLEFANDIINTAARSFLLLGKQNITGTGNANYGWVGGGAISGPTYVSSVERLDYANDTNRPVLKGPLSLARQGLVAVSNFNYGWFGGGFTVPPSVNVSTVDRIDFANDNPTSASPRGPLTIAARSVAASGNQNYGWWMGGLGPSPTSTVVSRLDYSNDTAATTARGFLAIARAGGAAAGNASYGWHGQGGVTVFDRIDFSNDSPTASSPRGSFTIAKNDSTAISNYVKSQFFPNLGGSENTNGTYGWVIGGSVNPPATTSAISRIDFNNDTVTASARGPLPATAYGVRGVNNDNYGWGGGGSIGSGSNIYRIDFSNDSPTGASQRSYLPYGVHSTGSASNINYGWWAGGNGPAILSAVNRLDFSNDLTNTSLRGPLSSSRYLLTGVSTNDYGWFAGGSLPPFSTAGNSLTSIDRIDFANDSPSTSSRRGNLTVARAGLAASGNSNYGWFGGGQTLQGTNLSSIEKIDYSNDSPTAASTRGPLSSARYLLAAVGNNSYGWWAGGAISSGPVSYSTVDRLDYSNDSPTAASPRGLLNKEVWFLGSTSNYTKKFAARITNTGTTAALNLNLGIPQYAKTVNPVGTGVGTYGWTSGGSPGPLSSVERVDYSNDSPTSASTRGPLSAAVSSIAGTGNANYGWHGGNSGTMDRIDYANDSPTTASPRGQLNFSISDSAATSNASYGWFGGGGVGPNLRSSLQRIDFSNDSPTTASLRGNLTAARNSLAATGNANYGWFGGGYNSALGNPNGRYSLVERVDFSNDNLTASVRTPLSASRYTISATGNANYGWFAAMIINSTVERIDFSNDSPTSASIRGPLSVQRSGKSATMSNANYGWFVGGFVSALPTSIIDRIDFSNDSPTSASPRGGLTTARSNHAASSNYVK